MTKWGALSGMIVGGITVILWIVLGLSSFLYEMIPGFSLSLLSVIIVSLLTKKPDSDISNQFNKMENILTDMK